MFAEQVVKHSLMKDVRGRATVVEKLVLQRRHRSASGRHAQHMMALAWTLSWLWTCHLEVVRSALV